MRWFEFFSPKVNVQDNDTVTVSIPINVEVIDQTNTEEDTVETETPFIIGSVPGALDTNSPTWVFIRDLALEKIEKLRKLNDSPMDEMKTAAIRGEIKVWKQIIALPEKGRSSRPQTNRPMADEEY